MTSGAGARRKGHRWERTIAQRFREAMPGCDAKRGLQYQGGAHVADVDVPTFFVECKAGRQPNVRRALMQATRNAPADRLPLAVIKDDRGLQFAALPLDSFLLLVAAWWAATQPAFPQPANAEQTGRGTYEAEQQ